MPHAVVCERDGALEVAGSQPPSPGSKALSFSAGPAPAFLAFGFVLTGIGTVMLGPLLPTLSAAWGLSDARSGILLAAKFSGAFLGGFGVLRRLGLSLLLGAVLCAGGFGLFGLAEGLLSGSLALFVAGLGLGQIIASTNILLSRRYPRNPASALSLFNFFWSLGAVVTGLLIAGLVPRLGLRSLLMSFATLFVVSVLGSLTRSASPESAESRAGTAPTRSLSRAEFSHFAALLLLYGGLETSLTGWLTTYMLRFSDAAWLGGQSAVVWMWAALTVGRVVGSPLMRRVSETRVRSGGLLLSLFALAGIMASSHAPAQISCCVLLGLGLAPFFPATFARLMRRQPRERIAGLVLALSGVGAAFFPWLMGVASARTGSLRTAMAVTLFLTLALLVVTRMEPRPAPQA